MRDLGVWSQPPLDLKHELPVLVLIRSPVNEPWQLERNDPARAHALTHWPSIRRGVIPKGQGHQFGSREWNSSTHTHTHTLRWSANSFLYLLNLCRGPNPLGCIPSDGIEPRRRLLPNRRLPPRQEELNQDSLSPPAYEILIL